MPISCAETVGIILANDAPLLLVDACSLLDIVRAQGTERESLREPDILAIYELCDRIERDLPGLTIVINGQVHMEFNKNLGEQIRQSRNQLARVNSALARMRMFQPAAQVPPDIDFEQMGFPGHAGELCNRIIASSVVVEDHADEAGRAYARMGQDLPPAKRGKNSAGDCLVVETYLRVMREVRNTGFTRKAIFITSNTNDFQIPGGGLHPHLQAEFDPVGLRYWTGWNATLHDLDQP